FFGDLRGANGFWGLSAVRVGMRQGRKSVRSSLDRAIRAGAGLSGADRLGAWVPALLLAGYGDCVNAVDADFTRHTCHGAADRQPDAQRKIVVADRRGERRDPGRHLVDRFPNKKTGREYGKDRKG